MNILSGNDFGQFSRSLHSLINMESHLRSEKYDQFIIDLRREIESKFLSKMDIDSRCYDTKLEGEMIQYAISTREAVFGSRMPEERRADISKGILLYKSQDGIYDEILNDDWPEFYDRFDNPPPEFWIQQVVFQDDSAIIISWIPERHVQRVIDSLELCAIMNLTVPSNVYSLPGELFGPFRREIEVNEMAMDYLTQIADTTKNVP